MQGMSQGEGLPDATQQGKEKLPGTSSNLTCPLGLSPWASASLDAGLDAWRGPHSCGSHTEGLKKQNYSNSIEQSSPHSKKVNEYIHTLIYYELQKMTACLEKPPYPHAHKEIQRERKK